MNFLKTMYWSWNFR